MGNSFFALLKCQLKRPVSRMKEMVPCYISLLESAVKSLHPYNKICDKSLFEGLVIPRGLIKRKSYIEKASSLGNERVSIVYRKARMQAFYKRNYIHVIQMDGLFMNTFSWYPSTMLCRIAKSCKY